MNVSVTYDICPKCHTKFEVRGNRAHPAVFSELVSGAPKLSTQLLAESSLVKCPNCQFQFSSSAVRFFGVLSPRQLRALLLLCVTAFAAFAVYLAVTQQ